MTTPDRARSRLHPAATARKPQSASWWENLLPFWQWLGISGAMAITVILVMINWSPSQVANIFFPNSYLPFSLPLLLFLAGLCITVWRHVRRGWLTAIAIWLLVFLRLQQVQLGWQFIGVIVISFVIIELLTISLEKRSTHHGNPHSPLPPPRRYY